MDITNNTMVFYGASGHATVVVEAWISSGGKVTAIFDDNEKIKELLHFHVDGKYDHSKYPNELVFLSIGSNSVRKRLATRLQRSFGKIIHPDTSISPSASLEEGSVVMAQVALNAQSKIGKHVILNTSSSIDHECAIDDFVHISPGVTLCGGVRVGEGTHLGAGSTVIQNITIGRWAVIGAGSLILENVPDYAVVVGVPGKVVRYQEAQY